MKVIIINGSPRKNGATASILHTIEQRLMSLGTDVRYVNLSELDMKQCNGCCSCYKTGHCYLNDDAEQLANEIQMVDGIVIGSPTYASNVSGLLKQFIDRGHFVIEQSLYGKYAVSIATGENYGSKDTSKIISKLLSYSGAKISGKIIYNTPFNKQILPSDRIIRETKDIADRLYKDIDRSKHYLVQQIMHNLIFSVGIKPFVLKKGDSYRGVLNRWRKIGILSNDT